MNSTRDALVLVGGAAFAWWLLKNKLGAPGGVLDTSMARPIAYVMSSLTLPARQHVAGGVVMQDGGYISFDAIIDNSGKGVDASNQFTWKSRRYRIVPPRRPDGNYNAQPV